jgi:hypothetical protein
MFFINPFIYAGGGDFESIATVTVGSGGASSIAFSSIPGTYQHLQVRFSGYTNSAGWLTSRINGLSASGQFSHRLLGDGSSASAASSSDNRMYHGLNNAAGDLAGVIDILDYTNTSKNKTLRAFFGSDRNGAGEVVVSSGLYAATSAVTSIDLLTTGTGLAQHTTAALYGVKAP